MPWQRRSLQLVPRLDNCQLGDGVTAAGYQIDVVNILISTAFRCILNETLSASHPLSVVCMNTVSFMFELDCL
jgi:hypothetical protein